MNSSSRPIDFIKKLRVFAALLVILTGATVLAGWVTGSLLLQGALFFDITVKTNTSVMLICLGLALLLAGLRDRSESAVRVVRFVSVFVAAISMLTLCEHLTDIDFGIDQLLFVEKPGSPATASPNRMGLPASFCFFLCSSALLLIVKRGRNRDDWASGLAMVTGVISLLQSLGYLFGVRTLFGIAQITGIALPTAVSLLLLSLGIILTADNGQVVALLRSNGAGGVLVRRLLPPALILPPLFGYIRTLGQEAGLYEASFGRALLVVAFIVVFARLVWTAGREIERIDSERRELIESERAARSVAESANLLKDQFLATISHELRSPLNAIMGWAQILRRQQGHPPEVSRGIETIERNARLQTQLINDLLDMSRAISGKLILAEQGVDLTELLLKSVQTIGPAAEKKQIKITHNLLSSQAAVQPISGDPNRLQQVFGNLLTNAIKFTQNGGTVAIELKEEPSGIVISVTDNGQGIKPEFLDQLFDRFAQADGSISRRHGGLGIGLSIAKDLVLLHGGTISAESNGEGKGAKFTVRLPRTVPHLTAAVKNGDLAPQHDFKGLHILAVEDEPDSREVIRRILEHTNAKVTVAQSAEEGLQLLEKERPDIILSDIGMPGWDGFQFIRKVREHTSVQLRLTPAIALTAFIREEDRRKALDSGYQFHIAKPLDPTELLSTLAKMCGRN